MNDAQRGLFGRLRRLLTTGLELIKVRVEVLASDVELGTLRFFDAIVLALVALLGLSIGIVLLCVFVLMIVQPEYRPHALAALGLAFLGSGLWALSVARARLRQVGTTFDATRAELARDIAALAGRD